MAEEPSTCGRRARPWFQGLPLAWRRSWLECPRGRPGPRPTGAPGDVAPGWRSNRLACRRCSPGATRGGDPMFGAVPSDELTFEPARRVLEWPVVPGTYGRREYYLARLAGGALRATESSPWFGPFPGRRSGQPPWCRECWAGDCASKPSSSRSWSSRAGTYSRRPAQTSPRRASEKHFAPHSVVLASVGVDLPPFPTPASSATLHGSSFTPRRGLPPLPAWHRLTRPRRSWTSSQYRVQVAPGDQPSVRAVLLHMFLGGSLSVGRLVCRQGGGGRRPHRFRPC